VRQWDAGANSVRGDRREGPRGQQTGGWPRAARYNRGDMRRAARAWLVWVWLAGAVSTAGQETRAFTVNDLLELERIGEPQVSPDGRLVAFTLQTIDLAENRRTTAIYLAPVGGGAATELVAGGSNTRPRWSPDSRQVAFLSDRSGSSQIWMINAEGAGLSQVTDFATEAEGHLFASSGQFLLFASEVYPQCGGNNQCNKAMLDKDRESKVQARIYDSLLYRHWDRWRGPRRSHLLTVSLVDGSIRDLLPAEFEAPPFSLGGLDNYAISPDSTEVCFAMNPDPEPARSTNLELFTVSLDPALDPAPQRITENPGADASPQYSPNGRFLAYRAQFRAGYESDRWRLLALDRTTGEVKELTEGLDRSVGSFTWTPDSTRLVYTAEDRGRQGAHMISVRGGGSRAIVTGLSYVDDIQFAPDGRTMVYTETTGASPANLYSASSMGGRPVKLTSFNDDRLARFGLRSFEELWVDAPDRTRIHVLVAKPPDFQAGRRYPVLFLIHGGPQGAWGQAWSYRWNAQAMAAAGFVTVMPNPRGSTGYGQQFTDEIRNDWGGKVYDDLEAVFDHVAGLPWADRNRMAAAGASYGGYMVNWLLGHDSRFRAIVSHAGVFDLPSFFGETEELWFPLWDLGGAPWENPEGYQRFSPSQYVPFFRTPTLVIHGEKDYRVPYGQALQLFTALKMQGVPSRLLLFPDEGHWILKPRNSVLWYNSFLDWIGTWTNGERPAQVSAE
jgi:dipeptidyl aminopeptidase/acylaminoacyl peptidase